MKYKRNYPAFLLMAILCAAPSLYSQHMSPAADAFQKWRSKKGFSDVTAEPKFLGVAVSATRSTTEIVDVNIVVALGPDVPTLCNVSFSAQAVKLVHDSGNNVYENLGNAATIRSPEMENVKRSADGIVANSRIKLVAPEGSVAVRVKFNDGFKDWSVILPLFEHPSTAMLHGTFSDEIAVGSIIP